MIPKTISKHNKFLRTKQEIFDNSELKVAKYKEKVDYKIGDEVRLKMSGIFANVRAAIKAGDSKSIVVNYTPHIFRIADVIGKKKYARTNYTIENAKEQLLNQNGKIKYFYASEILPSGKTMANITMDEALKLNKVSTNNNDLSF